MKLAAAAAAAGVPVLYYITPQVWAWGAGRLAELARIVTRAATHSSVRGIAAPLARHQRDVRGPSAARSNRRDAGSRGGASRPRTRRGRHRARALSGKSRAGDRATPRCVRSHCTAPRARAAWTPRGRQRGSDGQHRSCALSIPASSVGFLHRACAPQTPRYARVARRRSKQRSRVVRWPSRTRRARGRTLSRDAW